MDKVNTNNNPLSYNSKKRKIDDEKRIFNEDWTEKFAFIEKENKPTCLICNKELAHNKSGNIKRHYETKHINFSKEYPLNSDYRKNKIELLKTIINNQMNASSFSKESTISTEASFVIAWNIARVKHSYSDGEFVKQNISDVLLVLDPKNSKPKVNFTDSYFSTFN